MAPKSADRLLLPKAPNKTAATKLAKQRKKLNPDDGKGAEIPASERLAVPEEPAFAEEDADADEFAAPVNKGKKAKIKRSPRTRKRNERERNETLELYLDLPRFKIEVDRSSSKPPFTMQTFPEYFTALVDMRGTSENIEGAARELVKLVPTKLTLWNVADQVCTFSQAQGEVTMLGASENDRDLQRTLATPFNVIKQDASFDESCTVASLEERLTHGDPPRHLYRPGTRGAIVNEPLERIDAPGELSRLVANGTPLITLDRKRDSVPSIPTGVLAEVDLLSKTAPQVDRGETIPQGEREACSARRAWQCETPLSQWTLIIPGQLYTAFHCHSAGKVTCLAVVSGTVELVFPKGKWPKIRKDYADRGAYASRWDDGMFVLHVPRGTRVYIAPGMPYAIASDGESEAVIDGTFFYTATHFPRSMHCLLDYLTGATPHTDAIHDSEFRNFERMVEALDETTFSDDERGDVYYVIKELLDRCHWKCPDEDKTGGLVGETARTEKLEKECKDTPLGEALRKNGRALVSLLDKCAEWARVMREKRSYFFPG